MAKNALKPVDDAPEGIMSKTISERAMAAIQNIGGKNFKVKRMLVRPTLKHEEGETIAVTFIQPFTPPEKDPDTGLVVVRDNMPSPWTAIVRDLTDGEEKNLVLNKLFHSEIGKSYPNDTYVGKSFAVLKGAKPPKKRYHSYEIAEIEEEL